jgi:Tetratricopeptide repeat
VVAMGRTRNILPGLGWASGWVRCVRLSPIVAVPESRVAVVSLLAAVFLWAAPGFAQHGGGNAGAPPVIAGPPVSQPNMFPDTSANPFATIRSQPTGLGDLSGEIGRMVDSEACNSWTESGVHSPTVSAKRLEIPNKAMGEYQKGCGAFKGKRLGEAEDHLRKAVDLYADYAAAWVVLGQVLIQESKGDEAKTACSKAEEVDPNYVASYLCLADFAAGNADWPAVSDLAHKALAIDPIGNPYSLYYAADAGLHQKQLVQAEMHAQAAVKLDEWHHLPELHLLLAQIYQAAGNVAGETVQLKEFLKFAANSKEAPKAKTMLGQLVAAASATAITSPAVKDTPTASAPAK